MPCDCPNAADECDGEYATHYPLQDGGMCCVEKCRAQRRPYEATSPVDTEADAD